MERENILGFSVNVLDARGVVRDIVEAIGLPGPPRWLACLNPHSYVAGLKDKAFSSALQAADLLIADGVGIVYASKWQKGRIQVRVTGSDIFDGVNSALNSTMTGSVFFLGSTQECLEDIRRRYRQDYPNVKFLGFYSPPFKSEWSAEELAEMRNAINTVRPDVLWVGMTAPKQEKWIHENLPLLDVRFAAAIGAVFDFYVSRVPRSSPIFQKLGLEWLPRLLREPRRLWRRMLISAPIFIWHVITRG